MMERLLSLALAGVMVALVVQFEKAVGIVAGLAKIAAVLQAQVM